MLSHLIRRELLEHLVSLRFALACVICLVLVLSSTFILARDYQGAASDYQLNRAMHHNKAEESRDLVHDGLMVDRPPTPLQIFFGGVHSTLTTTAWFNADQEPQFEASYEGNPVIYLFPHVDLLFFTGIVMSLLAVAFSYDAISGEKEAGTLKLLMSYSVPRDLVLLAKWMGGYAALVTPFVLSYLAGLSVALLFPDVRLDASHWSALGSILLVSLLYLAAVYSLGVFVSARTHLASTSVTILLMIWVGGVLIVPNLAPYLSSQLHPLRDSTAFEEDKRLAEQAESERHSEAWTAWRADRDWDEIEDWDRWNEIERDYWLRRVGAQEKVNDLFRKQMDERIRLTQNLSRLSPLASFTYAASDLAGTGIRDRNRFGDQLLEYRREIVRFGAGVRIEAARSDAWDERSAAGYPRFVLDESAVEDRVGFVDILLLCVWSILFFMGAYLSFLRYDVVD